MPIKNYTTDIAAAVTVGTIQSMLARRRARRITLDYDDDGNPLSIEFTIEGPRGLMKFRYAPNVAGVWKTMQLDPKVRNSRALPAQAMNTAWRIELDWLEAQFAKLDATMATLEEIMLPYLVMPDDQVLHHHLLSEHPALPEGVIAGEVIDR